MSCRSWVRSVVGTGTDARAIVTPRPRRHVARSGLTGRGCSFTAGSGLEASSLAGADAVGRTLRAQRQTSPSQTPPTVSHECGCATTSTRPAAMAAQMASASASRIDQRIGGPQLRQAVHVAVADQRLAVAPGPAARRRVEVHGVGEHARSLPRRRTGPRGHPAAPRGSCTLGKTGAARPPARRLRCFSGARSAKRPHVLGAALKFSSRTCLPCDRALDARNEHDAALGARSDARRCRSSCRSCSVTASAS